MKPLVILLISAVILSAFMEYQYQPPISLQQTQVGAQVEPLPPGLLQEFLEQAWPWLWNFAISTSVTYAIVWVAVRILDFFEGRPDIGTGSATDDDARFFGLSANGHVRELGLTFTVLEKQGLSLSNAPSLFTHFAQLFCRDMEQQPSCGYALGHTLCQQYCYLASLNNANSNTTALAWLSILDRTYPMCH